MDAVLQGLRILAACLAGIIASPTPALAQGLDTTVEKLAEAAAREYVGPVVSGLGAAINAGWFHRAPPPKMAGFHVEGGVALMASFFRDAPTRFETRGAFQFDRDQSATLVEPVYREIQADPRFAALPAEQQRRLRDSLITLLSSAEFEVGISGATVIGDPADSIRVAFGGLPVRVSLPPSAEFPEGRDTVVEIPADSIALEIGGILSDLPALPMAALQITLGTLAGTQVTVRGLPGVRLKSQLGSFRYFGIGLQHNPGAWLPVRPPVDFSFGIFTQRLTVGENFTATATAAGLTVSRTFGWRLLNLIPYAGVMVERSTMTVEYDYVLKLPEDEISTRRIRFDSEGDNQGRLTLGLGLRLLLLNLNLDYSFGRYRSLSAGLMAGF